VIIAIDGPAASGKGTLGRLIAAHYGLAHLDTGKLYRAIARDVLAAGRSAHDIEAALAAAKELEWTTLGDPTLMDSKLGEAASIVAGHPEVRRFCSPISVPSRGVSPAPCSTEGTSARSSAPMPT
jgi:cytidylate kinase